MFDIEIKEGTTRLVILTYNYAIKIPNYRNGWALFLHGILSNIQEYELSKGEWHNSKLCPIYFYFIGGFCLIMPRAQRLELEEFLEMSPDWRNIKYENTDSLGYIPVEWKPESFGKLGKQIVAIDYGN